MRSITLAVLAVCALVVGTVAASAPPGTRSAEELLALMIWGLDPTSRTERASTWEIEEPDGDRAIISVSRLSDCLFTVSVEKRVAGHMLEIDYSFDFAAVRDYSAWLANGKDQRIITKIEGKNWYDQRVISKADGHTVQSIKQGSIHVFVAGGGSIERVQAAFEDFRVRYCKARSP